MIRHLIFLLILAAGITLPWGRSVPPSAAASPGIPAGRDIGRLIGEADALVAADPEGRTVLSIHADKMLLPASTLKILTALVARHYLGPGHRYKTEVYLDSRNNLAIKGYGDPLLISEVIREICKNVAERTREFNDLIVDGSYFSTVTIPGVTDTVNPYDAPCGALSVNFNTVNFKRSGRGYVSAEPQTPIVPFIHGRIRKTGLSEGRIVLSAENGESTLYAGHLFRRFLADAGAASTGAVKKGTVETGRDRLLYRYTSVFTLDEIIERLLMHSNNFMANQLLITAGIAAKGPPGTLRNGVSAADAYIRTVLNRDDIRIAEGSGISRENRITAACMMRILAAFTPHHHLLREEDGVYFKTGSLSGVRTRAGYIRGAGGGLSPFVVMLNTPGKRPEPVVSGLARLLGGAN
ncbi:D-alanyl-D-alanine carboxypeptidase/D-alanyl-D-alanine-endopeptidase [Desulfococcus sp.]|uniref:D-alanyl-D-alanine carboxypeptidase/D-alanyl-D-alanine-endopeptidase n=1 Tax=Desulfococcus sp. TaxID=2025834 RepID=UPI00359304EA